MQYFVNNFGRTSSFLLKTKLERWYNYSPLPQILLVEYGECLWCFNFERNIVDTLCHALWRSDTT
jgi:hypothetical protein